MASEKETYNGCNHPKYITNTRKDYANATNDTKSKNEKFSLQNISLETKMLVGTYLLLFLKKQLLPFNTNKYSKSTSTELSRFLLFAKFTNMKAMLSSARAGGTIYKDWKPFSVTEIRSHLGLYILNGLSPSPLLQWMNLSFQLHGCLERSFCG